MSDLAPSGARPAQPSIWVNLFAGHDAPAAMKPVGGSDVVFIAVLLFVCGLSVWIGVAAPLRSFAHDVFFFLDNGYRVAQGQVPHRDFSSAWGPVMFLMEAAGLGLAGMTPAGLGIANGLFGGGIAVWTFLLARPRWSPPAASAIGIYAVLLMVAPFALSFNPLSYSYAMLYNRYGYALIGLILLECASVLAPRPITSRQQIAGAASTGAALAMLLFLKVSFAIFAAPFIALSLLYAPRRCRIAGLTCGFGIFALAMLSYLRFDLTDIFIDLRTAATARRQSLMLWRGLAPLDALQIILILLFVVPIRRAGTDRRTWIGWLLFALATGAVGYVVLVTNQQKDMFPLNGYFAIIVAAYWLLRFGRTPRWPGTSPGFATGFLLVFCVLPVGAQNALSLLGAAAEHAGTSLRPRVAWPNAPPRAASLWFAPRAGERLETAGTAYVDALRDGIDLLQRRSGPGDGVLTFDMFNPFNYLLNRPSPRGGFAAPAYDYIFSDAAYPPAARVLGDAPLLLVRRYDPQSQDAQAFNLPTVAALSALYGPDVRRDFDLVEETAHWQLWRRRRG